MSLIPYVNRQAVRNELALYDFDTSQIPEQEEFTFTDEAGSSIIFDRNGLHAEGTLHCYNHMAKPVVTGNYCKRVWTGIRFAVSQEQVIDLPPEPLVLKMLETFHVQLSNQQVLDYILANKENAFRQIYTKRLYQQAPATVLLHNCIPLFLPRPENCLGNFLRKRF